MYDLKNSQLFLFIKQYDRKSLIRHPCRVFFLSPYVNRRMTNAILCRFINSNDLEKKKYQQLSIHLKLILVLVHFILLKHENTRITPRVANKIGNVFFPVSLLNF